MAEQASPAIPELPEFITDRLDELDAICREHHVQRLELFGSAATGNWDPERSDIDFLVEYDRPKGLIAHWELSEALKELLGRDVDLVSDTDFKNPYFRQSVEDNRRHLWGERRDVEPQNGTRVSEHPALKYLWDIQQEAKYIESVVANSTLEDVLDNHDLRRSVPMSVTLIGEQLNALSRKDPDIAERIHDYRSYVGLRNIISHQYYDIDWERLWDIASREVPLLLIEVEALQAELVQDTEGD